MPSSKGSSQPRDQTQVSCIAGGVFYRLSQEILQADLGLGQVPGQALPRFLTCKIVMKIVFFCLFVFT